MTTERRITSGRLICRRNGEDGPLTVSGYAAVFYDPNEPGTEYKLSPRLVERIDPGAFGRALAERDDARALFNHDPDNLLARVSSGTLNLYTDAAGLRYSFEINEADPDHLRVLEKIRRGDLTGSSFSFAVDGQRFDKVEDGPNVRTILAVELFDVGPVTFPAYEGTTANAGRAAEGTEEALRAFKAWEADQLAEAHEAGHGERVEAIRRKILRGRLDTAAR